MEGFEHYLSKNWLSPSAACSFSRCKRRYFYKNGCGLRTPSKSAALTFGSAIHMAIPYAFKGDLNQAMLVFCDNWSADLQDPKRNVMRAKAMLENFAATHAGDKSIYQPLPAPEGRLKVEAHMGEYEVPFALSNKVNSFFNLSRTL